MKTKFGLLTSTALAALALVGCGDDDGNGPSNADQVVASFDDLSVCTPKREGATAYVKDEKTGYVCKDGDWVPDNDQGPSSGTSSAATGSSENGNSRPGASSDEGDSQSGSGNSEEGSSSSSSSSSETVAENRCQNGTFTDTREEKTYKCVTIGSQTWMAQNLDYDYKVNGWTYGNRCYNNSADNCIKYGRLYTWGAAMDSVTTSCGYGTTCAASSGKVQGICPEGWHLPSRAEWITLRRTVGDSAGTKLKSATGWAEVSEWDDEWNGYVILRRGDGTDAYGFSALPSGASSGNDGHVRFFRADSNAYLWSSSECNESEECNERERAWRMDLSYNDDRASLDSHSKDYSFAVRCVKD